MPQVPALRNAVDNGVNANDTITYAGLKWVLRAEPIRGGGDKKEVISVSIPVPAEKGDFDVERFTVDNLVVLKGDSVARSYPDWVKQLGLGDGMTLALKRVQLLRQYVVPGGSEAQSYET